MLVKELAEYIEGDEVAVYFDGMRRRVYACPEEMASNIGEMEVIGISSEYDADPYDDICSTSLVVVTVEGAEPSRIPR